MSEIRALCELGFVLRNWCPILSGIFLKALSFAFAFSWVCLCIFICLCSWIHFVQAFLEVALKYSNFVHVEGQQLCDVKHLSGGKALHEYAQMAQHLALTTGES